MTRFMVRVLLACTAFLLLGTSASANTGRYEQVSVRVEEPWGNSSYGYAAYRVTLTNEGADDRTVTIVLEDEDSPFRSISGSAAVPAGTTVQLPLYQPSVAFSPRYAGVSIDGSRQRDLIVLAQTNGHGVEQYDGYYWGGRRSSAEHLVLVSSATGSGAQSSIEKLVQDPSATAGGYSGYSATQSVLRAPAPAQTWPADWLEFSRYAAMVLSASEFEALPERVRGAILGSVHAGGNLLLVDGPSPGEGGLRRLTSDLNLAWERAQDPSGSFTEPLAEARYGFGAIQWASTPQLEQAASSVSTFLFKRWTDNVQGRSGIPSLEITNRMMPVVDGLSIPRRMTFVFLLVFAILVGPVNLILLSRMNRRTLLFVTVPVLGVLFSATVFAYGLLHDGLSTTSRLIAITVLDQPSQRASTLTQIGFYAPLTPRGGLTFPNDTEVTPALGSSDQRLAPGRRVTIAHGEGQHFRSGWISPRQPAHFLLRTHRQRRERVLIERDGEGNLVAVNGLGVTIESLVFHDEQLRLYAANDIGPGDSVVLDHLVSAQAVAFQTLAHQTYPSQLLNHLSTAATGVQTPRTYVALIDGHLFAPRGRDDVKDFTAQELVVGTVGPVEVLP